MDNYTEWEHHVPDYTWADDGFGNLILTELDMFWYNVDNMRYEREGLHD